MNFLQSHNSLIIDSVMFYARAIENYFTTKSRRLATKAFTCEYGVPQTQWEFGDDFFQELLKVISSHSLCNCSVIFGSDDEGVYKTLDKRNSQPIFFYSVT